MRLWITLCFTLMLSSALTSCFPNNKSLTLSLTLLWPTAEGTSEVYPASVDRIYIRVIDSNGSWSGYSNTKLETPIELKDQNEGTYEIEVTASLGDTETWRTTQMVTMEEPSGDSADWTVDMRVTMAALVDFSFASPDTVPVNSDPVQLTIQSTGFNTNRVIWRVNGITGGNDEFGRLTSAGLYTPPANVPSEPVITIEGFPEGFEAFASSKPVTLVRDLAESAVIFGARSTPAEPIKLWRSDGTSEGTYPLGNVTVDNIDLFDAPKMGDTRYFRARGESGVYELWQSDGSVAGTKHIPIGTSESAPGMAAGSYPNSASVLNGRLYLNARTSQDGLLRFISLDPETGDFNVLFVYSIASGNGAKNFTGVLNDELLVAHNNYLTGTYGVYTVDEDSVGFNIASQPSPLQAHDFAQIGDDLLFVLNDQQLIKTDGTPAGTSTLLSVALGAHGESTINLNSSQNALAYDGAYYFTSGNRNDGYVLHKSDGTVAGTQPFITLSAQTPATDNPHTFFEMNNTLYFFSDSSEELVRGLWMSQGSTATTTKVKTLNGYYGMGWYEAKDSAQFTYVPGLNKAFFVAEDYELWVTDGTADGTVRVKDFGDAFANRPGLMMSAGNFLLFTVIDADGRAKLWRTDGTEANTEIVKDVCSTCSYYEAFYQLAG